MTPAYRGTATWAALAAAIGGFGYSVSFVIIRSLSLSVGGALSAVFLTLGGLVSVVVAVALFHLLRETDAAFALLGLLFAALAGLGASVHGAHDLALATHPPAAGIPADLPSEIDPRGFLTFGVAGLGIIVFSWLILRGGTFRPAIGYLGYLSGGLLIVIFLARLTVFDPKNLLVLGPAGLEGFIVNPLWYLLLGLALRRGPAA